MVLAREISARWVAKNRINPATPATTHNPRKSPCSGVNAFYLTKRNQKAPQRERIGRDKLARSCLCSRIRYRLQDLTANLTLRSEDIEEFTRQKLYTRTFSCTGAPRPCF